MPIQFEHLDERTRRFMLEELERDVGRRTLHISPYLSEYGRIEYESLLRTAIQAGTDASLATALGTAGRMRSAEPWRTPRGRVTTRDLPSVAPGTLAEDEFHRFYVRGLCRRALAEGLNTLIIYRAAPAPSGRADADRVIGLRIDAGSLLEDLRAPRGQMLPRGLAPCLDSGLSVRLP